MSPWRMSECRMCSLTCLSMTPPARCTIAFGLPVVPDENSTYHGWSYGNSSNSAHGVAAADPVVPFCPRRRRHDGAARDHHAAPDTESVGEGRGSGHGVVALAGVGMPTGRDEHGRDRVGRTGRRARPRRNRARRWRTWRPTAAAASPITTDSIEYGTTATTRSPGRTPSASSAPAAARTASDSSRRVSTRRVPSSPTTTNASRSLGSPSSTSATFRRPVREERRRR